MRKWKILKSMMYTIILLMFGFFIQFKIDQYMSTIVTPESSGYCQALHDRHNDTEELQRKAYDGWLEYVALTRMTTLEDEQCSYLDTSEWSD